MRHLVARLRNTGKAVTYATVKTGLSILGCLIKRNLSIEHFNPSSKFTLWTRNKEIYIYSLTYRACESNREFFHIVRVEIHHFLIAWKAHYITHFEMSTIVKSLLTSLKRPFFTSSAMFKSKKNEMLGPLEINTGVALRELMAQMEGDDDPWDTRRVSRAGSSRECPTMIPSAFDSRVVGCVCHEDATTIRWMILEKGEPKRCECGCWFQLCYKEPV